MTTKPKEEHLAKVRSAGFFTKGIVYLLIGALTLMAALGLGGDIASRDGVVLFLLALPAGKLLGAIVALGLIAYSIWRLSQAFFRPKKNGNKPTGIKNFFTRFRYFYSSLLYGIIAYSFGKPLVLDIFGTENPKTSEGDEQEQAALGELLTHDWGKVLIWALAAIIAIQAIWQFRLAYTAHFMKKIDQAPDIEHEYEFIRKAGRFGYSARGLVFGIISFFLVQVILEHNARVYKGTEGALQYLLSFSYGSLLLALTAIGLAGYGVFNIMVARHADYTRIH
ncbi:MAG: DUF1206 domain-containing protein [Salinimicrobium sp.]